MKTETRVLIHIPAPRAPQPLVHVDKTIHHDIHDPHHDNHKLALHVTFVTTGIIIMMVGSAVPGATVIATAMAGLPSVLQELIDWLRGW